MSKKKNSTPQVNPSPDYMIDPMSLFRLPWTMSDNAMTWLEPTRQCNINCDACFHENDPGSQKSLEQIEHELDTMLRLRRCDAMLIAGGEPLVHPQIIDITKMVKSYHVKPVLITNGVGLNQTLVHELKEAGMHGFTFHVDAHQDRPGWAGKSETELNTLRQRFADMLKKAGGLACAFNITVFPDTLKDVAATVNWAVKNIDRVHIVTFIPVRMVPPDDSHRYFVGGEKINIDQTPYVSRIPYKNLSSTDVYKEIIKALPDYEFCAYLGGTALPTSLKWILGSHIGNRQRSFGSLGPKSMELLQYASHFFRGKYLSYTNPTANRRARLAFLLSFFDREMRQTFKRYMIAGMRDPRIFFKRIYIQSISAVQPVDILPTGEQDNCDGCPNKTYWNGRLVSACRFEEYQIWGAPITIAPAE
jgi:organic radical activating enzyme